MLAPLSRSERRRRADEVANLVRIDHRLKHRPSELSRGEQQRVAVARAILADPPLLLCDEPTGELDRATSGEVMNILRTLCDELGKTIIMVTHDPSAAAYADQVYHFDKGQLSVAEEQAALAPLASHSCLGPQSGAHAVCCYRLWRLRNAGGLPFGISLHLRRQRRPNDHYEQDRVLPATTDLSFPAVAAD